MKKYIIVLSVALLASGCSSPPTSNNARPNQIPTATSTQIKINDTNSMDNDLKTQLEAAYAKARTTIVTNKDVGNIESVIEDDTSQQLPKPDEYPFFISSFDTGYPDLKYVQFIKIEQKGNYAYYFAQVHLPHYDKGVNIAAFAFHKQPDASWKLSGKNTISSSDETVSKSEDVEKAKQSILSELENQISEQDNN